MNPHNAKLVEGIMPDREGPYGRAWRYNLEGSVVAKRAEDNPNYAGLGAWIVECPSAHPVWANYFVSIVHLRTNPGGQPPRIGEDKAVTHEINVLALNPDFAPDPTGSSPLQYLHPINFAGQWRAGSDIAAEVETERVVEDIINGRLNPDTDALSQWIDRFGDNCMKPGFKRDQGGRQ